MEQRTRSILLGAVAVIAAVLIGVWWWSGFTLDFMRFFAAEPTTTCPPGTVLVGYTNSIPPQPICSAPSVSPLPTRTDIGIIGCRDLPPGCTCQQVECFRAPCDPIVVCPTGTPPSGAVRCAPVTQSTMVGGSVTLTATGGQTPYRWFAPGGEIAEDFPGPGVPYPQTSKTVRYDTPGVKKVTVQSARGDNINTDSVACTVVVQP